MPDWASIAEHIARTSGTPFSPKPPRSIGGGCINTTLRFADEKRSYFVKLNEVKRLGMFEAEAAGLREMGSTATIRVPDPLCHGVSGDQCYLVLEFIEFGRAGREGAARAGRRLAAMHRRLRKEFGWIRDNTIGSTPQSNRSTSDWIEFWRDQRLGYQLELAARNGHGSVLQSEGEKLLVRFPALIDHAPAPSLLHGDLWGGNLGYDERGEPVVFDPAVYYGDREADLAMTELFGGFSRDFYAAYREAWPLDPGYDVRKTLYNLYHILNHLNLFGGGYLAQSLGMMDRLLAELG